MGLLKFIIRVKSMRMPSRCCVLKFWLEGLGALSDPTAPRSLNPEMCKWFYFCSPSLLGGSIGSERGSWWVVVCLVHDIWIKLGGLKWV